MRVRGPVEVEMDALLRSGLGLVCLVWGAGLDWTGVGREGGREGGGGDGGGFGSRYGGCWTEDFQWSRDFVRSRDVLGCDDRCVTDDRATKANGPVSIPISSPLTSLTRFRVDKPGTAQDRDLISEDLTVMSMFASTEKVEA